MCNRYVAVALALCAILSTTASFAAGSTLNLGKAITLEGDDDVRPPSNDAGRFEVMGEGYICTINYQSINEYPKGIVVAKLAYTSDCSEAAEPLWLFICEATTQANCPRADDPLGYLSVYEGSKFTNALAALENAMNHGYRVVVRRNSFYSQLSSEWGTIGHNFRITKN